jgi:aerotaxis receptor
VTQREYVIDEHDTLLSATDLKGRVTYANDAFIQCSGFEREELYGKAHNVVRHPDMPEAAFADMWSTVQRGRTWTALVKNRRKNGDHYWVRANATPIRSGDEVVGYLSVRTRPEREAVERHESLYERLRAGAAGLGLRWGHVVRPGLLGLASRWRFVSLAGRMRLGLLLLCALGWANAWLLVPLSSAEAWGMALMWTVVLTCAACWLRAAVHAPLKQVLAQAQAVAAGQRAQSLFLHRADEVGAIMRSIEQAGLNLVALVSDIQAKSARVGEGAAELQAGNEALAERTGEAATCLEETAAANTNLATSIRDNSATAVQAEQLARQAVADASRSAALVGEVHTSMGEIASASQRVSDITAIIDGIAFQTNILALNAAVEAARAGEQGKGFAVVAAEVRTLSQRSAAAAKEIRQLIEVSHQRVDSGTRQVEGARQAMDAAVATAERLAGLMEGIRTVCQAQASGVEQINAALGRLDEMTQGNALEVQQVAGLGERLSEQARRLDEAAMVFRLGA